jgi:peptide/nickel transport system permease protein
MMFDAIVFRDFPLAQGMVLFAASVTIVVNLIVDISYSFLDPRIRRQ